MATTKTNKTAPQFVWVFENQWEDRHGDKGSNVKVFSTKAKANKYFAADIKNYLENYSALDNGEFDTSVFDSFNTDTVSDMDDGVTLAELQKAATACGWLDINVDSSGTNSTWSVSRQKVE